MEVYQAVNAEGHPTNRAGWEILSALAINLKSILNEMYR